MKTVTKFVAGIAAFTAVQFQAWAVAVKTTASPYKIESDQFEGLVSVPEGTPKGGILIVHNWMGVTAETRKQAERFAALGYVVVSADIYGKGLNPSGPEQAGKLAGTFKKDRKLFRTRLTAAFNELSKRPEIKNKPLLAAGYCFGGTGVLELARTGANLKAVMSFHGGLDSPAPADGANIKAAVYAFHGADDPYVSASDISAFEKEMSTHKVDWQLVKFGGAVHSFTDMGAGSDNTKGAAYNASADARSFEMAKEVLK
jgi:dienelactone hydrolase